MNDETDFRSGFISIVGRPNVGKSTLVNAVVGEKIAAVSDKPNTTRNRILGIRNLPDAQFVFLDTPGIHKARGKLGKAMVQTAMSAVREADVILMMVEVKEPFGKGDTFIIESLPKPAILLVNKIDKVKKGELLPILNAARRFGDKFLEIIPISAATADGIPELLTAIRKHLPPGPKYFPDDMITDQPERFLAAELIREKIFNLTQQEIPYKTAVSIEEFKDVPEKKLVHISAVIYVERMNHKGIIIGKGGEMLKEI
ncbi:MAG: GTPase Era, partial [Candidatus Dadabacteria bacterium]|nr:GTPase Era [Candidatus Dadabacteria bacterium]